MIHLLGSNSENINGNGNSVHGLEVHDSELIDKIDIGEKADDLKE